MKKAIPAAMFLAATSALAHPGHGAPDVHFHVEWLLVVAAIVLLWWAWKR